MAAERLQKILARSGIASRRACEEVITAGRVRVNGKVVSELGTRADSRVDKIEVDGKRILMEQLVYIVMNKPRGVMTTLKDPEGRPTVAEYLTKAQGRVFPVGRLDFHTSGALLFTNDGDFADGLMHPKKKVPKTYVAKLRGEMKEGDFDHWRNGVKLDDGPTLPAEMKRIRPEPGKTWVEVTITEGRNQQIRRMGDATGFPVLRLARQSVAGVTVEGLRPGAWRYLSRDELRDIQLRYDVPKRLPKDVTIDDDARRARAPRTERRRAGSVKMEGAPAEAGRSASNARPNARNARPDEGPVQKKDRRPARGPRGPQRGPRGGKKR